jgi:hypothetical protein
MLVDEADCALVKKLEMAKDPFDRSMDSICCARCGCKTFNSQFSYHLKSESVFLLFPSRVDIVSSYTTIFLRHGINEVSDDDYLRPLDAPPPDTRIHLSPLEDKGWSI